VGRPIPPAPRRRGVRRDRHPGPETGGRFVERRWRPHQLLDKGNARRKRYRRDREGDRQAQQATPQTHPGVRPTWREGQRAQIDREVRDQQHPRLQRRGGQPERQHSHSPRRRRG